MANWKVHEHRREFALTNVANVRSASDSLNIQAAESA